MSAPEAAAQRPASATAHDPARRGLARHSPRVLMYHYFGTPPGPDPERLFVDRAASAAQLDHLRPELRLDGRVPVQALGGLPAGVAGRWPAWKLRHRLRAIVAGQGSDTDLVPGRLRCCTGLR